MKRLILIAFFSIIFASLVFAQKSVVDTLYTGLNNATSFIIANEAIYIVEKGNHRVLKLDLDGKLLEKYGNRGSRNYQFDNPSSITSSTGLKIFVSDRGNNRIQVFDKRWQYLSSIMGNEKFQTKKKISPSHLGVNKLGEIIFYDSQTRSLGKYDENGTYLDQIPLPSEIKDVSGFQLTDSKIFLLDKKLGLIHRLSANGFYESFYPAKKTTAFYYKESVLYVAQDGVLRAYQREQVIDLVELSGGSSIQSLNVIDDEMYILTFDVLVKMSIK